MVDGMALDATVSRTPRGPAGEAKLQLRGFILDPFVAWLPAGLRAVGVVSGTATALAKKMIQRLQQGYYVDSRLLSHLA